MAHSKAFHAPDDYALQLGADTDYAIGYDSTTTDLEIENAAGSLLAAITADGDLELAGDLTIDTVSLADAGSSTLTVDSKNFKMTGGADSELRLARSGSLGYVVMEDESLTLLARPASGVSYINLDPYDDAGAGDANIRLFRNTNTTGTPQLIGYYGNGTNTPTWRINSRTGEMTGVTVTAGTDGTTQGVVTAWDGGSGEPGTFAAATNDGTVKRIFLSNRGDLRVHSADPSADTDGSVLARAGFERWFHPLETPNSTYWGQLATGFNGPIYNFANGSDRTAEWIHQLPETYQGNDFIYALHWTVTASADDTEDIVLNVASQIRDLSAEGVGTSYGTEQSQTVSCVTANNDVAITTFSSVTAAGPADSTPEPGDFLSFYIERPASTDANDTFGGAVLLLGVAVKEDI